MRFFWKVIFFLTLPSAIIATSFEFPSRIIQAHLELKDFDGAIAIAKELLAEFPDVSIFHEMMIKSMAAAGEISEMMERWNTFHHLFPDKAEQREILEEMCWGVLLEGHRATGVTTQLISILGAALTQQVRAVEILKEGMWHSNAHIRAIAVSLAAEYSDQSLREEVARLFYKEKVWEVKKEVLKAVVKLRLSFLLPELKVRLYNNPRLGVEERKELISTIIHLQDTIEKRELDFLVHSKCFILRILAAESIAWFSLKEEESKLRDLLSDHNPDVRIAALEACGLLRSDLFPEIMKAAESFLPEISITAGWVILLSDREKGEEILRKWITSEKEENQLLAIAAVTKSGKYGISLAQEQLPIHPDPYVRANCALALLYQRVDCEKACQELDHFLRSHSEKLMWAEGFFSPLQKSTLVHTPLIPNYPEVANQTVRLEILNLLSIVEYPGALEGIKQFLKEGQWKVTGRAAEMLLGEGDEEAIANVCSLLQDPSREIRIEAALILATWGHDPAALPVLMEAYKEGDRSQKLKILEALGCLGDASVTGFLIERLKEPWPVLRMAAACMLIRTLNH